MLEQKLISLIKALDEEKRLGDKRAEQLYNMISELADYLNQEVKTTSSPTFAGLTLSNLTASAPVVSDGNKKLVSQTYANFLASLSGKAQDTFSWNAQDLINISNIFVSYFAENYTWEFNFESYDMWTEVNSGSGYVTKGLAVMKMGTGATSGSSAMMYSTNSISRIWGANTRYSWKIVFRGTSVADSTANILLIRATDVVSNQERVGFRIINGVIYALSGDEANEELTSTGVTAAINNTYYLKVIVSQENVFNFYVNNVLKVTHSGISLNNYNFRFLNKIENSAASDKILDIERILIFRP